MPITPVDSQNNSSNFLATAISSAGGGGIVSSVLTPLETLKKDIQRQALNRIFFPSAPTLTREHPYRGVQAFTGCIMANSLAILTLNKTIQNHPKYDSKSFIHEASAAVASGLVGAIIASAPIENMILWQRAHGVGPKQALIGLCKQSPTRLWTSLPELMTREGVFSLFMCGFIPMSYKKTMEITDNESLAKVAKIATGVLGAFLTHPLDMAATYKQTLDGKISTKNAIKELFHRAGPKIFWTGISPRVGLFVGFTTCIPEASKGIERLLKNLY